MIQATTGQIAAVPRPGAVRRTSNFFLAMLIVVWLGGSLLAFNSLQMASTILLPFSRRAFRAVNRFAAGTWWGWCVTLGRRIHGVRLIASGDPLPERENALIVANHQTMTDITHLMALAKGRKQLGNLKWFVKDIIKYVPGIGWGMLFLDCLFVKRSWSRDKKSVTRVFERLTKDKVPFWIVTFAEGTRGTAAKIARAREWAQENKKVFYQHVLAPRTSGFVASVQGLGAHMQAVYDVTIGYPNGPPSLWQYITGRAKIAHLHVRRYVASELPDTSEALADWLRERFGEKDAALETFYSKGTFSSEEP